MSARRTAPPRPATPGGLSTPLVNAAMLALALGYGLWLLVARGRVGWPPHQLLASTYTVAGCLALVGPVVLLRREAADGGGLGELIWMTGGLLVWLYDAAALIRGELRSLAPATPLAAAPMGLTILAVALAGWRTRGAGRSWAWTNVTGWVLGVFWIGMAVAALVPAPATSVAAR
jgi:hypothetical protein